jgi:hypothetical protein
MDTKQLIKEARARFDHNSAKQLLREKYQAKLTIATQGGLWKATPELIGYLATETDSVVILIDEYENPVLVNRILLHDELYKVHNDTMTLWYKEYQELSNNR